MLSAAQVREQAVALPDADPETTLTWAVDTSRTSDPDRELRGGGGRAPRTLSRIDRTVPVLFLDTAFHFPRRTVQRALCQALRPNVVDLNPLTDPGPLYQTDPDRCCTIRKVERSGGRSPGFDAWNQRGAAGSVLQPLGDRGRRSITRSWPADRESVFPWRMESGGTCGATSGKRRAVSPAARPGYSSIAGWPCTRPTAAWRS